jgi:phosphatidate cytidylyltransferase
MLLQRILTAAILIPLTLLILFYASPLVFLIVTGCVFLAAAWEWSNLMGIKTNAGRILYLLLVLFIMGWVLFIPVRYIYTAGLVWWIVAIVFIISYPTLSGWWGRGYAVRGMMGLLTLIPCWTGLNILRNQPDGIHAILLLFLLVWSADTFAFFVGRRWGKHKLCPLVSPQKSWEGFFAALIGTIGITTTILWLFHIPQSAWGMFILLTVITVLFSIVGDLLESMLKRHVGLKDSGRLLPGHGGLLDRIDSLTAAVPIFAAGGLILSKYWS